MKIYLLLLMFISILGNLGAFELSIDIRNISNHEGIIGVAIFNSENGFPNNNDKAIIRNFYEVKTDEILKFELNDGYYAIAIFQDKNNNQKLDTKGLGIPAEPFGFSNNPKLLFGPPSFSKAKINLNQDKSIKIYLKKF